MDHVGCHHGVVHSMVGHRVVHQGSMVGHRMVHKGGMVGHRMVRHRVSQSMVSQSMVTNTMGNRIRKESNSMVCRGVVNSMVGQRGSMNSMASMATEGCEGSELGVSIGVACHQRDKGHKTEGLHDVVVLDDHG